MTEKPGSITLVGTIQLVLAGSFVIWLLGFPTTGEHFAWPIKATGSALFIGAGFLGRVYIGCYLVRERDWAALGWQVAASFAFLGFIWLATLWHMGELNWKSNIWVAHVWALAYTIEPVVLILWRPTGAVEWPAARNEGPILPGLQRVAMVGCVVTVTLAGLMMVNPAFMDTRWPWPLDPFDCRVMSGFLALNAGWCYTIYKARDWAQAKKAVIGADLFVISQLGVWLALVWDFDSRRHNRITYGLILAGFAAALSYYFVRQQRLRNRG